MNLAVEKISLAQTILSTQSPQLIKNLKALLNSYETDLWDELSEDQKESVIRAKSQLAKGEGTPHKKVMKKYQKWRLK